MLLLTFSFPEWEPLYGWIRRTTPNRCRAASAWARLPGRRAAIVYPTADEEYSLLNWNAETVPQNPPRRPPRAAGVMRARPNLPAKC